MTSGTTALEVWDDSVGVDHLWTNGNLGEAVPGVMTPATWSTVSLFMSRAMTTSAVPGARAFGRIRGRFYLDLSVIVSLAATFGVPPRRVLAAMEPVFGTVPPDVEIPLVAMPRARTALALLRSSVTGVRRARAARRALATELPALPQRCTDLRTAIAATADPRRLATIWTAEVDPLLALVGDLMDVVRRDGKALVTVPARLTRLVGAADAEALTSAGEHLASMGPLIGLARLERGEIDRDTYVREHGHRGPHEFELSVPRPAEDLDRHLAQLRGGPDPRPLLARREAAREEAWQRLVRNRPRRVEGARRGLHAWADAARQRERIRSASMRVFWVARAFFLRAGVLTGLGEDVFLLSLEEVLGVLSGAPVTADVAVRRATYAHYRALPAPPPLVRGTLAAAPGTRAAGTVRGTGASAGIVTGRVRVLPDVAGGDALRPGEVLVTTVTNVGWTPLFPRAAAIVTDVGARLSHAAVVARELGIPAVVGCGDATAVLRTGDQVRVDGTLGTVQRLP
ncbi:PEP-utilizing enzyme [Pseudonocardia kunmingensis]|uniref:PEP-utilizing family enzyme n=1 Tax=Pseudonocardia kunmingensis TaxID=630975 RepID=A0A543E111_9PSEU|nr:PEP-utilizing enzyme [Pseudonocardia kunmingensis]TQM15276.1 PEP-utilizing family enzyme [Pseudonocardia kunmingensis]